MMLIPAGMFAMFYFLSQVVQDVMGYSSLKAGSRSCRSASASSSPRPSPPAWSAKVDPRWLAGGGALLAAIGIWGFSRIPYSTPRQLAVNATYVKDLLPWILVMSFGMGFVFVPAHADRGPRRGRA